MKKKTLNPSAQDLKIQWEIQFSIHICANFQFDHFPMSKIDFESSLEIRRSIFLLLKKIAERFVQQKKVENWISPCIFKSYAEGFRVFFLHARALIFSPNALYLPNKQPWGAPSSWLFYNLDKGKKIDQDS